LLFRKFLVWVVGMSRQIYLNSWKPSLVLGALSACTPLVAYSQTYLTEDQALKELFPGEKFTRKTIELSHDELGRIKKSSGEEVRNPSVVVWVGEKGDVLIVDQALGKHEFITYVVGIASDHRVKGIEILEYRETYGGDVRKQPWRDQFVGKNSTSTLKLGKDITNISGATLSSAHITAGVKRILQTYETIRNRL
jgi:Na+-translocating ferredoxin:NAD+ oxidoreductase RnfG subunit